MFYRKLCCDHVKIKNTVFALFFLQVHQLHLLLWQGDMINVHACMYAPWAIRQ